MGMINLKNIALLASLFLMLFSSSGFSEPDQLQKQILDNLPPDQRAQVMERMQLIEDTQAELDEENFHFQFFHCSCTHMTHFEQTPLRFSKTTAIRKC